MLRITILSVFICLGLSAVSAQVAPSFSRYGVPVERKSARSIDFRRSPGASSFRTRISSAFREPVNFAGHYILTGWGCGTGCIYSAIIDVRDGRVYFPMQLAGLGVAYNDTEYEEDPLVYRKNSRLLILKGSPGVMDNEADKPTGTYYYEWNGNRLRLVRFVGKKD